MKRHITVRGIQSGDYESWVLLVDHATFLEVTGEQPTDGDIGPFVQGEYRYMLYPHHLFGDVKHTIDIDITVTNPLNDV